MSIPLIVFIAAVVVGIGLKLRRGTFFRWSDKHHVPKNGAHGRGGNDVR
jgi:hypothetical protein